MSDFDRLRTAGDIRAVFAAGTVARGTAMVVHARRRSDDGPSRAAVVGGRKVGGAVRRNRAKRRLRAALHRSPAPGGLDIVVAARAAAVTTAFEDLAAEAQRLVTRAAERAAGVREGRAAGVRDGRAAGAERQHA